SHLHTDAMNHTRLLFFPCSCSPLDLHSFPTRRSSDLLAPARLVVGQAVDLGEDAARDFRVADLFVQAPEAVVVLGQDLLDPHLLDRKSTRLNSSHVKISYAVFCLKKKKKKIVNAKWIT